MALVLSAQTAQGANTVRFVLTGAASGDSLTVGLNGDSGAGAQLPASWIGTVGDGQGVPAAATLTANTRITIAAASGTTGNIGGTGSAVVSVSKGGSPWRATFTLVGTPTGAAAVYEVFVEYLQSVASGGAV